MSLIDEDGSARRALLEVVRESGPATLDDPARLGAVLSDLLPNNPREATLLVTAAGARVAGQLAARTAAGMSPEVAVRDVAALLSDAASLDLTRATWVVTEYAHALGYLDDQARSAPPFISTPPFTPAPVFAPPAPVYPAPAWPAPPPYASPVQPGRPDAAAYPPPSPAPYPPPPYQPPPYQPPVGPGPARSGRRSGLVAAIAGALAIVAVVAGVYAFIERKPGDTGNSSEITGLVDFHGRDPDVLVATHQDGPITYTMTPPVGGHHNGTWQNCDGRVYPEPIADENAVHSLEHGAVWITFSPALAADDRAVLAAKVNGKNYMLMSPYGGLPHPVYLQAWGYQLAVDDVRDPRIDAFIARYRITAAPEPGALCTGGTSQTGVTPHNAD